MHPTLAVFSSTLLKGKVALITGGGSGICYGITEALMRHGARTAILSRTKAKVQDAATALQKATGGECLPIAADVRKYDEIEASVKEIISKYGALDILINGAAGNFLAPAQKLSANAFKTVIEIDLGGTFNVSRACYEELKKTKGCIMNVSATLSYTGLPFQAHAGSAKAGIDALTKHLAVEWGPDGIRVNAVAPGPIDGTEGMSRLVPASFRKKMVEGVPLRRMGTVEDIEQASLYLCSDASSYVSGIVLIVDGGSWMTQGGLWQEFEGHFPAKM